MSKERLKEIKSLAKGIESNVYTSCLVNIFPHDFDNLYWAIRTIKELEQENKEYRESVNLALNHIHTGNFNLATVALNKALLKEVEQ